MPVKSEIWFDQIYVQQLLKPKRQSEAVLFLHGYPADEGSKNLDIAESLGGLPFDVYLIHYRGLGESYGKFSFLQSLEDVRNIIQKLDSFGYNTIHIVGHSWGGYLTLMNEDLWSSDSKIVLMSPFLSLPDGEALSALAHSVFTETKRHLKYSHVSDMIRDLEQLRSAGGTFSDFVRVGCRRSKQITILQAKNDIETPAHIAEEFCEAVGLAKNQHYLVESDHSFTGNRHLLVELIRDVLKESR